MTFAHSMPGRRPLLLGLGAAAIALLACFADSWAFAHLSLPGIYDEGWGRLLRSLGYLPLWLLVGFAVQQSSTSLSYRRHGLLLMLAPTLSGALSEVLKLLVRRERPVPNAGLYVFRSFADRPFSTGGFGMPSGDVIVAFAACTILARAWPRTRVLWYGLGVSCALARVLSRAHFLSDVTVAGLLGVLVADRLWLRYALPSAPSAQSTAT
jgi:membrane-associated phospholipid phosphatase